MIADELNSFFISAGTKSFSSCSTSCQAFLHPVYCDFTFIFALVSREIVKKAGDRLKSKTSRGWDGLSSKLDKFISPDIIELLTLFLNQSISTGIFRATKIVMILCDGSDNYTRSSA